MYLIPDTAQPDHAEIHDNLSTGYRPRHARTFEPLREHRFAGRFGDPTADGQALAAVMLIAHPMTALFQVGIRLIITLGVTPQPVLAPQGRCRLQDSRDPIGLRFQSLAHLVRPCLALGHRSEQGISQLRNIQAGVVVRTSDTVWQLSI